MSSLSSTPDTPKTPGTTQSHDTMTPPSRMSEGSSAPSSIVLSPITPQSQSPLLRTPLEIIHKVLCSSGADDPFAIAQAARTCRELRSIIYENPDQALWRDIHLRRYDDPRCAGAVRSLQEEYDWKKSFQDREFVSRISREWDEDRYDELSEHLDLIISTLLELYLDMPPSTDSPQSLNSDSTSTSDMPMDDSLNAPILESVLRSDTFQHIYLHQSTRETKKLLRPLRSQPGNPNRRSMRESINPNLSRLHVLLCPEYQVGNDLHREKRGYLRELVYSASNFTEKNDYGPFHEDGTVNWVLVDAIGSVMMSNAKDVLSVGEDGWRHAVLPLSYGLEPTRGWGFNNLHRPSDLEPDEVWDWAGVQGQWCGSYAFLDYTDWISLNEPRLVQLRRSLNELDLSRYHEAIGDLMRLNLTVVQPCNEKQRTIIAGLPAITTPLPTSTILPPIQFCGSSVQDRGQITHSSQESSSFVRGVVTLTADDPPQVRWTLVIRYGGEDRWRLECVQVGGRGSKRGFFGVWTDALKEEHSPNGPIWYWKP